MLFSPSSSIWNALHIPVTELNWISLTTCIKPKLERDALPVSYDLLNKEVIKDLKESCTYCLQHNEH